MTRVSLPILALAGLVCYLLLALWFPLLPHHDVVPPADIRSLAPSLPAALAYTALLLLLFALMGTAHRRLKQATVAGARSAFQVHGHWFVLLTGALFALPLLFTFPINATDVYRYFIQGRVATVYGQDPLSVPPAAFPDDPYLPLAGEWAGESSPYGPLWEGVAAAVTAVAGDDLLAGLLLFKLLGAGCHLLLGLLIFGLNSGLGPQHRTARMLLWSWNPALLLTFVMDAHNDALMLLWLVLGYLVWQRGRPIPGFLLMCLAALTKPVGALLLPVFFLAMLRTYPTSRQRVRIMLAVALGTVILIAGAFLPFGSPFTLAQRLLRESSLYGGFSPMTLVILALQAANVDLRLRVVTALGTLLFSGIFLWLLLQVQRGRVAVRAAADTSLAYIATAFTFRIWYSVWPFPWFLADASGSAYRLHFGLWLLLCAQLSVLVYGHLRYNLLGGSQLAAHLIGVPFVFLLPLLLARFSTRHNLFAIG